MGERIVQGKRRRGRAADRSRNGSGLGGRRGFRFDGGIGRPYVHDARRVGLGSRRSQRKRPRVIDLGGIGIVDNLNSVVASRSQTVGWCPGE